MCAYNSLVALEKLRKRTKPIRAWKVLRAFGHAPLQRYYKPYYTRWIPTYGPGQVKAKRVTCKTVYVSGNPRGLHVYRTKRAAASMMWGHCALVSVYIDPADLIAAERSSDLHAELVTCRLTIRPGDWEAAGLPKLVTRRRYI